VYYFSLAQSSYCIQNQNRRKLERYATGFWHMRAAGCPLEFDQALKISQEMQNFDALFCSALAPSQI
jgi:hypothetical protein